MPSLWSMLKDEGCLLLIVYQRKNYPKHPLTPPGEIKPVTSKGQLEDISEIDRLMGEPPNKKR